MLRFSGSADSAYFVLKIPWSLAPCGFDSRPRHQFPFLPQSHLIALVFCRRLPRANQSPDSIPGSPATGDDLGPEGVSDSRGPPLGSGAGQLVVARLRIHRRSQPGPYKLPKPDLSKRRRTADPTSGGIVAKALTAQDILCHSQKIEGKWADHKYHFY